MRKPLQIDNMRGRGRCFSGPVSALALVLCVLITACSATLSIRSDFDRLNDFSQYRSFSWVSESSNAARNPDLDKKAILQIQQAIINALGKSGYEWTTEPEMADFLFAFTINIDDRIEVYREPELQPQNDNDGTISTWGSEYFDPENVISRNIKGSLSIHIYDVVTRAPVWYGVGSRQLEPEEIATVDTDSIAVSVAAILESFPPDQ